MEFSLFLKNIFFVIVVYQRKADQSPAFNTLVALADQLSIRLSIFVYDNSREPSPPHNPNIFYRHDPANSGVSKAYNEASFLASINNKKWMLLLDQDTEFEPDALKKYYDSLITYPEMKIFAPRMVDTKGTVSPFKTFWGKGRRISDVNAGINSFHSLKIINSGILISLDAFNMAGGFDEQFPLDLSDFVFTDRLLKCYPQFVLINCTFIHHLSADDINNLLKAELKRFEGFILAVKLYKKKGDTFISVTLNILPRSILLSIKYKTLLFLQRGIASLLKST